MLQSSVKRREFKRAATEQVHFEVHTQLNKIYRYFVQLLIPLQKGKYVNNLLSFLFLIGLHGKGDRDFMNRKVQNPTMLVQIVWKSTATNEVVSIVDEVTFSDRATAAAFIAKRISCCNERSCVERGVVPSFRVYYLVRANYKI